MSLKHIPATRLLHLEPILVLHIEDDLDDASLLEIFTRRESSSKISIVHTPLLNQALALYQSLHKQLEIRGGYQKEPIIVVDFNFGSDDSRETVASIRKYEREANLVRARSILFSGLDFTSCDSSYLPVKDLHDFTVCKNERDGYKQVSRKIVNLYQSLSS
ncbi:MAG: hypothetical protein Q8Q31_00700 [Nanoarchaeota archaeon]|nr:hypothetical protein [Nanoarchaeota archaeon]